MYLTNSLLSSRSSQFESKTHPMVDNRIITAANFFIQSLNLECFSDIS